MDKNKEKRKLIAKSIVMILSVIASAVTVYFYAKVNGLFETILIAVLYLALIALFIFGVVKKKSKPVTLSFYSAIITLAVLACYVLLQYMGWLEYLSSEENIRNLIGKSSPWGEIIFVAITFAQVTLVPIPSTITIVAGVVAFGVGGSILYSTIGLLIGSMFAFFLGRTFGMKIVRVTIGEGMYNKYQNIVKGKDKMMLFLMFLLPFFPDDLLCIVAGLTNMSYMSFFIMMLITRPIGVSVTSVSSKLLAYIPLSGWGLVVWGVLIVAVVIAIVLLMKYGNVLQDRMVYFFDMHFNKARKVKGAKIDKMDINRYAVIKNAKVISNNRFVSTYGGAAKGFRNRNR